SVQYCTGGYFFFFSSRRRHTILVSDWSSDVCSSDLLLRRVANEFADLHSDDTRRPFEECIAMHMLVAIRPWELSKFAEMQRRKRSEERRVGKECRAGWEPEQ